MLVLTVGACYNTGEVIHMQTKDVLLALRTQRGLSQDELAEKVYVTRQAVSRWETGETTPNTDTLKLLAALFDVSIDMLLGEPRQILCRHCGMSLQETVLSPTDICPHCGDAAYWERYVQIGGEDAIAAFKAQLIEEINALQVEGMAPVEELNALPGSFVNVAYRLPGGQCVPCLDDDATYLGNQLPCLFDDSRCFGIVANMEFILVCTYEENGANPELLIYKKR